MINPTRKLYLEVISTLDESVKKDAKILYDEKEVGFGDPTHIQDLKTTLQGLIRLRDILNPGSAFRNVCSQTIERLRKLVDKCENLAAKQPPLETVEKRVFENRFTPVVEHPYEKLLFSIFIKSESNFGNCSGVHNILMFFKWLNICSSMVFCDAADWSATLLIIESLKSPAVSCLNCLSISFMIFPFPTCFRLFVCICERLHRQRPINETLR